MTDDRALRRLRSTLDRLAGRRDPLPPPQVLVTGPGLEFSYGDRSKPFHTASVGKVMTATLIAGLIGQRRLDFDTPIGKLLPAKDISGLPTVPGVDAATDVTVEHLLTHTSGLPDYFEPPKGTSSAASAENAVRDPDRQWAPADLLDEVRRLPALGAPGQGFHYSDTGFVVLGRIAEEQTGEPLDALLSDRIYRPSGMERSWTPYSTATTLADIADLDVAPFWVGKHELSGALAMSLDWAGGGIVAPPDDLVRFQRALHGGHLVPPDLLAWMARPRHRLRRGIHYGAGLVTVRFGEFVPLVLRGLPEPVGGVGYFGTQMFYYRLQDAHVILNFHSSEQIRQSFQFHVAIARMLSGLPAVA